MTKQHSEEAGKQSNASVLRRFAPGELVGMGRGMAKTRGVHPLGLALAILPRSFHDTLSLVPM